MRPECAGGNRAPGAPRFGQFQKRLRRRSVFQTVKQPGGFLQRQIARREGIAAPTDAIPGISEAKSALLSQKEAIIMSRYIR